MRDPRHQAPTPQKPTRSKPQFQLPILISAEATRSRDVPGQTGSSWVFGQHPFRAPGPVRTLDSGTGSSGAAERNEAGPSVLLGPQMRRGRARPAGSRAFGNQLASSVVQTCKSYLGRALSAPCSDRNLDSAFPRSALARLSPVAAWSWPSRRPRG